MRSWIRSAKGRFQSLPMRRKLMISFSVPTVLICFLITLLASPVMSRVYSRQIQYSVNQSYQQAENFISDHIQNMYYVSQLIEESGEIHDQIKDNLPRDTRNTAEAYREFYAVNQAFQSIEVSNASYRMGMYVPDSLEYSNNNKYFFPESQLQQRADYAAMEEAFVRGQVYYTVMEDTDAVNPAMEKAYIMQLRPVRVLHNGEVHRHIIKVGIAVDQVEKILQNARNTKNNLLYMMDEKGTLLAASDQALYRELEQELPEVLAEPWSRVKVQNRSCYLICDQIKGYNWKLFSVIPVWDFKRQAGVVSVMMLLICSLLAGATIGVSRRLAAYYGRRISVLNEEMGRLEAGHMGRPASYRREMAESGDEIDSIYESFAEMSELSLIHI